MRRALRALATAMLVVGVTVAASMFDAETASSAVISYGSGDYRYQQVAVGGGPHDFSDIDFDDSAFNVGSAPFGHNAGFGCGLTPVTPWLPDTDLLVRRSVSLPAGTTDVVVHVAVDNDIEVFWNGSLVAAAPHDGCAQADSLTVAIPQSLLTAGANVLAVRASDRGGETFLDLEVTANLPPDCASVAVDHDVLWPPNHDLRVVSAVGGSDPEGGPVGLSIVSVQQDEPLDDAGDGNTAPDAVRSETAESQVWLRAERAGDGDGRVYRLDVMATDADGASCSTVVFVGVPHDRRAGSAATDTIEVVVDSFGAAASPLVTENDQASRASGDSEPATDGQQPESEPPTAAPMPPTVVAHDPPTSEPGPTVSEPVAPVPVLTSTTTSTDSDSGSANTRRGPSPSARNQRAQSAERRAD